MPSFQTFMGKIVVADHIAPSVIHLRINTPENFTFRAGQFVSIVAPLATGEVRRPYSIASSPSKKGSFELCVKRVEGGRVSCFLDEKKTGEEVKVMGPFGEFKIRDPAKETVFIATGTGIAPLRSMYLSLLESGAKQRIYLFTGGRFQNEVLYQKELLDLQQQYPNFLWKNCVSRPEPGYTGDTGHVQELLEKYLPSNFQGDFYLCGLYPMIQETVALLETRGVSKERVFYERYS